MLKIFLFVMALVNFYLAVLNVSVGNYGTALPCFAMAVFISWLVVSED